MNTFFKNKLLLTLSVALVLSTSIASESWAVTCKFTADTTPGNEGKYTLEVEGDAGGSEFTTSSCNNDLPQEYSSWSDVKSRITSASFNSNVTSIGDWAFQSATSLQSVDMPNVTSIGHDAFSYASSLQSVDMPNVTSIGALAFYGTTSLQSVDMPNVTTVGSSAFGYASSLQSVDMPNVTSIGDGAFYVATSLSYAGLNTNISSDDIASNAFSYTKISGCNGTGAGCGSCSGSKYIASGRGCVTSAQCSASANHYFVTENNVGNCVRIPSTAEECATTDYYYNNGAKCVKRESPTSDLTCATGYHLVNSSCVMNTEPDPQEPQGQGGQGTQGSGQATSAADCKNNGQYWQEGKCVSSCGPSFKLNDGWCDRKRYTPAEAAAILNDDDNTITITFKK